MYESKEILKNQFKKLPKDIQDAILAVDLRSKMQFITKKNNLHIDQAETLENEAVFVMLGLEHPENLVANIAKHVEVSEEKAEAIAEDLNREIFLKVRESLKKIFEERNEEGGGNLLASSLLEKTEEKKSETETDETLKREDILREIEDKEHHNLPTVSKQELHLEARLPSEISAQGSFQNTDRNAQTVKLDEAITQSPQKKSVPQEEIVRTMEKDIFKTKMGGMVSVPKETIVINNSTQTIKKNPMDSSKNIDPYRERLGG
ncbi:MAG: seg [Parcubacteria group bacterium]|nr:seg [Parcubacteria group bacterium]